MNKKYYISTVAVEKKIKYSLPKYKLGEPITVDVAEEQGNSRPQRWTIVPFHSCWSYDYNENRYFYYRWDGEIREMLESYIDKNIITE